MSTTLVQIHTDQQLTDNTIDSTIQDKSMEESSQVVSENHGVCAICLDNIILEETALVKGCEHSYCVTCILRWATYSQKPSCPQCKHPFESLNVHRSLDGSLYDYMFEESVCLLLRATWFSPLIVEDHKDTYDEPEDFFPYEEEEEDDDPDEAYFNSSPSLRIGNRRWGDNGYVRGGRQEARPVRHSNLNDSGTSSGASSGASSSRATKNTEPPKIITGRRAKRAMKREAADKAAAEKHQQHLLRTSNRCDTGRNMATRDGNLREISLSESFEPEVVKDTHQLPARGMGMATISIPRRQAYHFAAVKNCLIKYCVETVSTVSFIYIDIPDGYRWLSWRQY